MAERSNREAVIGTLISIAIGAAIGWAGSDGGDRAWGFPIFAICSALAFAVNWAAFVPAALQRTEHYYDLTGGITYITTTIAAVVLSPDLDLRSKLVAAMVLVWSVRLATFLFMRISRSGGDSRFDNIKHQPARFFLAWTLQGLWVVFTAAAAWAVITGGVRKPLGLIGMIGIAVWAAGMLIEIVADNQKSKFRSDPSNKGRFINVGLWSWSRHPNYFGEITLWTGMAIVAIPVLQGWQWATLVSPFFVALLLIKISGIPLLEETADERWGGQDDYDAYKQNTSVLVPMPPGGSDA